LFSYVWLEIVIKTLHGLCDSPLYKEAKILIRRYKVNLFEYKNTLKVNEAIEFDNNINKDDMDKFEKVIKNAPIDSLVQFFIKLNKYLTKNVKVLFTWFQLKNTNH